MGLFSTTSKSKTDMTTTPVIPDWVNDPVSGAFGKAAGLGAGDPNQYVAPASDAQNLANDRALALGSPDLFSDAAAATRAALTGGGASASTGTSADKIGLFMNPYQDQVMSRGLDAINRQGDRSLEGVRLQYAGPNYGNNASVSEALTRGEIEANKGDFLTSLLSGGWESAAGLADAQANRDTQVNLHNATLSSRGRDQDLAAAAQLASIAGAQGASNRADIGTLLDTGGTMRSIDSDQRTAPLDLLNFETGQYAQLQPGNYIGQHQVGTQTTKNSGGLGSQLLNIGGKIAAAYAGASDIRLKRDIERVGTLASGIGIYAYRYLWSQIRETGVLAQEVLKVKPEAVMRHPSGYLMVNYGAL